MNRPSSNTFNVGAPTFSTVAHPFRGEDFHYTGTPTRTAPFPFWNDSLDLLSMILKTNHLVKPSSNTLNVGAPTFPVAHPFRGEAFHNQGKIAPQQRTPSGLKGLSYTPVSQ
jgi:hypothetical protein